MTSPPHSSFKAQALERLPAAGPPAFCRRTFSPRRAAPQVEIFPWQLVLGLCSTLFGAGFFLRSGERRRQPRRLGCGLP